MIIITLQDKENHQHKQLKMNLLSGQACIFSKTKFRNNFESKKIFNIFF